MANNNVDIVDPQTFPFFPPKLTALRMRHFDPQVFNTSESSRLYKFIDALAGDVGAGQLKKNLLIARLSSSLDTLYFGDLDDAFGNLDGLARFVSESYPYDPTSSLLTSDQWNEIQVKDSWYRQRIKDFFQACSLGGTPTGIRMMLRAALGVDCDIFEVWRYIDDYAQYIETTLRENLVPNPSFRTNLTGWTTTQTGTGSAASVASVSAIRSPNVYRFTTTSAVTTFKVVSGYITINPSTQYVASGYTRVSSGTSTSSIKIDWYTSSNVFISSNTGALVSNPTSSTMTRRSMQAISPANAAKCTISLTSNALETGIQFEASGMMLETGTTPTIFFDGNSGTYDTANANLYKWTGTPNNSSSKIKTTVESYGRLGISLRNEFVVKAHKASLTPAESRLATKMIERIKPADSVVTVNTEGLAVHALVNLRTVSADSSYFIVERTVTGVPDLANLPAPEIDVENIKWLQANVPNIAPTTAFGQTQEHSYYYLYSDTSDNSSVDTITYEVEDTNGNKSIQSPLIQSVGSNQWSAWIDFDIVDSPDNYPGGKFGQTPFNAPAVYSNGGAYVFPYTSQAQYVSTVSALIQSRGGQVQENRYRLPNISTISSKARFPQLSLSTVEPTRDSTVTSSPYVRIKGQIAARFQDYPSELPTPA